MKVFLSLPMSGRTEDDIRADLNRMKTAIIESHIFGDEEIEFRHNLDCSFVPGRAEQAVTPNLLYLGVAIKKMAVCHAVVIHEDFEKFRGCCIEANVCIEYDIPAYVITKDGFKELKEVLNENTYNS